jgi:hypothetical protein
MSEEIAPCNHINPDLIWIYVVTKTKITSSAWFELIAPLMNKLNQEIRKTCIRK